MSLRKEILEAVRELPGITSVQLQDLLPHAPKVSIRRELNFMFNSGKVTRTIAPKSDYDKRPGGRRAYAYRLAAANQKPVVRKMKRAAPTAAGYEARIAQLNERLTELENWKADAIKRYPDLAVAPEILQARKIVAETMAGDKMFVDSVMRGEKDSLPIMKVALRAMEMAA